MLKLTNIKKSDSVISASYTPENSKEVGKIAVDIHTGKITKSQKTSYDEVIAIYLSHAKQALLSIIRNNEEIPEQKIVMWY